MVNENEKSQFNDALGFLKIIRNWFNIANTASSQNDLYNWWNSLRVIFGELSSYINDKEEYEKKYKEIIALRDEIDKYIMKSQSNPTVKKVPPELYWKLNGFQLYLKKIYFDSGLETKMQDSALNALR